MINSVEEVVKELQVRALWSKIEFCFDEVTHRVLGAGVPAVSPADELRGVGFPEACTGADAWLDVGFCVERALQEATGVNRPG